MKYIFNANAGHTGGSLSCIDILNVLYNHTMNVGPENFSSPDRDRYIQSKGHSVEALFVVLADKGFFPESDLNTLCRYQSHYIGHPTKKVKGVEQNTVVPFDLILHITYTLALYRMSNEIKWHHGVPSQQQFEAALSELDTALVTIPDDF